MKPRSPHCLLLLGLFFFLGAMLCPAPPIPVCPDCVSPVFDNGPASASGEPLPSGEYATSGDFDGDGRDDILILDKSTGVWRRGSGDAAGAGFNFDRGRPSGTEQITGMTAGHFSQEGITTVLVCSPTMNRVQKIAGGAASFATDAQPVALTVPDAGPIALGALDVPGNANTNLPEIALATIAGAGTSQLQRHVYRAAQTGSLIHDTSSAALHRVLRLDTVILDDLGHTALGAITAGISGTQRFELWHATEAGGLADSSALLNLPLGTRFISGRFDGANVDVLLFKQGSATVLTSRLSVDANGHAQAQATQSHTLANNVRALYPITREGATTVLALFSNDTSMVLNYTQANGFTLASANVDPAASALPVPMTGAVTLPNGDYVILTGDATAPTSGSTHAHRFSFNTATGRYALAWSSALPAARAQRAAGNVLVFDKDPLADDDARLIHSAQFQDWTRNLSHPIGEGFVDLSLQSQAYVSKANGLGNSQPTTLTSFMVGNNTALGNQTHNAVSVFTFDSTLGSRIDDVVADPPSGSFDHAVALKLRTRDPSTTIYWRKGGQGPFTQFPGQDWLYTDATVEFYGRSVTGALTPRQTASYHFTRNPKEQDADGDGVPDFVEVAFGLDPEGNISGDGTPADFDSDGWSDLDEILAGANPGGTGLPALADPAQHPDFDWKPPPMDQRLTLNVRPIGTQPAGTQALAGPGTLVEVHDTAGALLAKAEVTNFTDGTRKAVLNITNISDAQRILIVSTQLHFRPGPEPWPEPEPSWPKKEPCGRELLGYVEVPAASGMNISFDYAANLDNTSQALDWVIARRALMNTGATRPETSVELNYTSTLKVLLLERILKDLSALRGIQFNGSLTPFRDTTQAFGPVGFTAAQIEELESAPEYWSSSAFIRAWKFSTLLDTVDDWIDHPTPALATIKEVTRQVYKISSDLNNDHPGVYALPATVLREWLQHSTLDAAYRTQITGVGESNMMGATMGFYTLTGAIPTRPVFDALGTAYQGTEINSDRYTAFTSGATTYNLLTAMGGTFHWPGTFGMTAGSQVRLVAFNDVGQANERPNLEVIRSSLDSFALAQAADADGNLLPDAWEMFFFGDRGLDAKGNRDGSGFSLLQEYLQGTDPTRSADGPTGLPVALEISDLRLDWPNTGNVCVRWAFPVDFGEAFSFGLQRSDDLATFSDAPLSVLEETPGNFCTTCPRPVGPRGFYRVVTRLK